MSSKKAVTDIILAIGILVAILVVFLIGMRVFSLVVKETPDFLAKEMAFTADTALAAPENVQIQNTLPQARTEGFLKLTSKHWVAFIDPKASETCAGTVKMDWIKAIGTAFATAGFGLVGFVASADIKYSQSGDSSTVKIAGYEVQTRCSHFTEDKYAPTGEPIGFLNQAPTSKIYNETTNTNMFEVFGK